MRLHEMRILNRFLFSMLSAVIATFLLLGPAAAESLLVRTVEPTTGNPLAGAFVMVGPGPDQPFVGNYGTTAPDGTIQFDDPALTTPAVVTAGTVDRAYVTVTAAPADSVTLRLPLRAGTGSLPPPIAQVTGTTPGIPAVNNNSMLEMGFVLPALDIEAIIGTGQFPFNAPMEMVNFPILGDVELPGIVVIPSQVEFLFFTFSKPNYLIELSDGTTQSLFCPAGRIPIEDLLLLGNDMFAFLNALEITDFGIERDVPITNGAVINVGIDHAANAPVTMQFGNVPAGDMIRLISGARIAGTGGAGERYVLFDGASQLVGSGTVLSAASVVPGGDLADAVDATIAFHADSSAAEVYMSGIVERDGFIPPITLTADSFFLVPSVLQNGNTISYSDPENPGISPVPTWTAGVFALSGDSGDPTIVSGMHWQVLAPAAGLEFTLPELPPTAPPGLPDPSSTPGDDRLELTLTTTNNSGGAREVLESMLGDATHFALITIEVEAPTTAVEEGAGTPVTARRVLGYAYPDPVRSASATAGGVITLPIVPQASGAGEVRIYRADGRLVRQLTIAVTAGVEQLVEWDGLDAHGRLVPAGTYFARLRGVPDEAEKIVVIP